MTQTDRITVDGLVAREVNCCLSALVSTLAGGYGADDGPGGRDLAQLAEQAFDLASPIDDWEEAAIQEGWTGPHTDEFGVTYFRDASDAQVWAAPNWQVLCEKFDLDPYQREVFEFWAVSPWLASQLAERGEKVDRDFAGLSVWARTTSGQGIAMDSVIQAIYAAMMAPVEPRS